MPIQLITSHYQVNSIMIIIIIIIIIIIVIGSSRVQFRE